LFCALPDALLQKLPKAGWSLLDLHGLPRYWPADWGAVDDAALAESTRRAHLYDIDALHRYLAELGIDGAFDDAMQVCDLKTLEDHLTRFYFALKNRLARSPSDEDRSPGGNSIHADAND
jgi:hypothetical protein